MREKRLFQFFGSPWNKRMRRWGCPDEALIAAYADHQLEGRAKEHVEGHLADCDFCLEQVGFLVRGQRVAAPESVSEDLIRQAQRLVQEERRAQARPVWRWASVAGVTATSILVIVAGIALRQQRTIPVQAPSNPVKASPVRSPLQAPPRNVAKSESAPAVRGGQGNHLTLSLEAPADGATLPENKVEFRWQPVAAAADYELELLTAQGDLAWTQRVPGSPVRLPAEVKLQTGQKYFVRVRANLALGKSVESRPVAFTVANH